MVIITSTAFDVAVMFVYPFIVVKLKVLGDS